MSQNKEKTFMARASLFASPKDSATVPKKKVAREAPLPALTFPDSSADRMKTPEPVHTEPKTPERVSSRTRPVQVTRQDPEEVKDDVEPMEVDTSVLPSPQRGTTPQRGNTPCSTATTPRRKSARKSMPTPGKRLFFTSKDTENENRKANETTQLELLMASVPEEMSSHMKALITDKKEMDVYEKELKQEIDEFEAVRKSRQLLLKNATEIATDRHISSIVPIQLAPLDLTFKKEEEPDQVVKRLHGNFLSNTQEAGKRRKANKDALIAEEDNKKLNSTIQELEILEERKVRIDEMLQKSHDEQDIELEKTTKKFERVDNLVKSLQPIPTI
ncbi:hypothetical protein CAEBREN_09435 [Caenorhabditis brenneri]|uniref:Uncharacterized protein n=1 Tax=Caenorhabditis brenneri TaxID=135651 RepID=G0MTB1_CAEBE|nr:hypothetical protein CAEBREN_09435 [Caenorhabditis brenneri]